MANDKDSTETTFLRRWSQRKLAATRDEVPPVAKAIPPAVPPVATSTAGSVASPVVFTESPISAPAPAPELPAVDSLTFDSDFTAFLKPDVDPAVKQQALKKLFADPRFNVMDGLDVYIDDYSKFEPMPPDLVATLEHARYLFDPPKTRVNDQGHVEDVADEPESVAAVAEPPEESLVPPADVDATAPLEPSDELPPSAVVPPATRERAR